MFSFDTKREPEKCALCGESCCLLSACKDAPLDSTHPAMQQLRPPPAAETGSSCWGSGQQDASAAQGTKRMLGAAQGTKRMLGAATRRQGLHALDNPKEEVEAQKS